MSAWDLKISRWFGRNSNKGHVAEFGAFAERAILQQQEFFGGLEEKFLKIFQDFSQVASGSFTEIHQRLIALERRLQEIENAAQLISQHVDETCCDIDARIARLEGDLCNLRAAVLINGLPPPNTG